MAEFFQLSTAERLDPLNVEANTSGLLPHLLEKDVWVVWSLRHLFAGPYADHLVFNGGTSLSKAYCVIRHFSEDVDPTYDIRAIAGDSVGDADAPLPTSFSRKPMQRNHHDELQLHRCRSRELLLLRFCEAVPERVLPTSDEPMVAAQRAIPVDAVHGVTRWKTHNDPHTTATPRSAATANPRRIANAGRRVDHDTCKVFGQ
jgi:hypothetical protein